MDIFEVSIPKRVEKELEKVPRHIVLKLLQWIEHVRKKGLREVRKSSGYHDEPVKGKERAGQRSVRLSKAWRAFYIIDEAGSIHFIEVVEVNHHEY